MDPKDETDWVIAQRLEKRRFANASRGVYLANVVLALTLFLLAELNVEPSFAAIGITFPVLFIAGIYAVWRSRAGSVFRSSAVTFAIIFGFGTLIVSIIYFVQP